jgi:YHS domain-containing protein
MARLIFWIIVLAILGRLLWRFMYAIFEGAGMLKERQERNAVKLVRDPVCGTYLVPTSALTTGSGDATKYFCSEKCRQQWGRG